jgi:hypothetical protein
LYFFGFIYVWTKWEKMGKNVANLAPAFNGKIGNIFLCYSIGLGTIFYGIGISTLGHEIGKKWQKCREWGYGMGMRM